MTFSISLLDESVPGSSSGDRANWGLITIGAYQERFIAPLDYWDASDYRQHWKEALTRITMTAFNSCLITSMYDPSLANFIYWWPMYRRDETVYLQNHILFLTDLFAPFDPQNPFRFVPEREVISENGEKISEWSVPITDLESFLKGWDVSG